MTATTTLASWLLEQIAADEADVRRRGSVAVGHSERCIFEGGYEGTLSCDCGAVAHVLAVCEAHRRIVALHAPDDEGFHICHDSLADDSDCGELRALAAIYADRDGFREDWAL